VAVGKGRFAAEATTTAVTEVLYRFVPLAIIEEAFERYFADEEPNLTLIQGGDGDA
jgi:hypothetical protein